MPASLKRIRISLILFLLHLLCLSSNIYFILFLESSVLTPYYKEDVLYSEEELNKENEDGISILFYLQKIYPGNTLEVIIPCLNKVYHFYDV